MPNQHYVTSSYGPVAKHSLFVLFGILLLLCASYSNSLYSPPALDDNHTFIENPQTYVEDFSLSSLKSLAKTQFGISRWLPMISFAVDHHLGKGSITQYHITNILIHLLSTLAVYFLINSITQTPLGNKACKYIRPEHISLLVAALWSLNPVQTNAVTYLVQRMASMCALFYLTAITCFIQARLARIKWKQLLLYFFTIFFTVLAFLSKENAATIFITMFLIEIYFFSPNRLLYFLKRIKTYQWIIIALIVIAILPVFTGYLWPKYTGYTGRHFTIAERLFTEGRIIVFYISLLLLPIPSRMNLEHDFIISHSLFSPINTLLSTMLLSVLLIYAYRSRKNNILMSFGIIFFFLNLAIESTVIPLELAFEHRLYLPSVGFFIAIHSMFDGALNNIAIKLKRSDIYNIFIMIMIMAISASSILTTLRNNDWQDRLTLTRDILEKSPNKPRAYNGLGLSLLNQGQYDKAFPLLEKAIELSEEHYEVYVEAANNIMVGLYEQGKNEEALQAGLKYIRETPYSLNWASMNKYLYNLARLLRKNERNPEALDAVKASITKDTGNNILTSNIRLAEQILSDLYDNKTFLDQYFTMGVPNSRQTTILLGTTQLLIETRKYEIAGLYLKKAKKAAENDNLIINYEEKLQEIEEKNRFEKQISSLEEHSQSIQNRKYVILMTTIKFIEKYYHPFLFTIDWLLEKAESIAPDDPFIAIAKSKQLLRKGKTEEALSQIGKGIQKNPKFFPLYELGSNIYQATGRYREESDAIRKVLELYPGHPQWQYFLIRVKTIDNLYRSASNSGNNLKPEKQLSTIKN